MHEEEGDLECTPLSGDKRKGEIFYLYCAEDYSIDSLNSSAPDIGEKTTALRVSLISLIPGRTIIKKEGGCVPGP